MNTKIIQERLDKYKCASWQDEEMAIKEICQEIILAALGRTDFFKFAAFQGGTALRIFYTLDRFSEDLDFILKEPDPDFPMDSYIKAFASELDAYGIAMEIQKRSKAGDAVQKLFFKEDSLGGLLILKHKPGNVRLRKTKIKFEIDTSPPCGSLSETKYLDFPFSFAATVQKLPSLFAGKSHALLCRQYVKGRDWYDFLWYVARETPLNYEFLGEACHQTGPWQGKSLKITKDWYLKEMKKKIEEVDWQKAKADIIRFLKQDYHKNLDIWTPGFFADRLQKMERYL